MSASKMIRKLLIAAFLFLALLPARASYGQVSISVVKLFDAIPAFLTDDATSPDDAVVFAQADLTLTCGAGAMSIISSTEDGTGKIVVDNFMLVDGINVCSGGLESPFGHQNCFVRRIAPNNPGAPIETILEPIDPLDVSAAIPLGTNTVSVQLLDFGVIAGSTPLFLITECFVGIEVSIAIKPGSGPNSIKLGSNGVIPVAILTTSVADGDPVDFDAAEVDESSLTLEGVFPRTKGKSGHIGSFEDVDGDGDLDLVVQFPTAALDLIEDDSEAILEGQTWDGTMIQGIIPLL